MADEHTLHKDGNVTSLCAPHTIVDVTMVDPRVTTLHRHFTGNILYFISERRRPLRNVGNDVTAGTDQRHFGCGSAVRLTGQGHSIADIQCQFSRLHRVQGE